MLSIWNTDSIPPYHIGQFQLDLLTAVMAKKSHYKDQGRDDLESFSICSGLQSWTVTDYLKCHMCHTPTESGRHNVESEPQLGRGAQFGQ